MAGTRLVKARKRLREQRLEQQKALTAASRTADAVETAQARGRALAEQGARLVADAEAAHRAAVVALVKAMGSVELAAAMLDVDEAVVREAVASKSATRKPASRSAPTVRAKPAPDLVPTAPANPTAWPS